MATTIDSLAGQFTVTEPTVVMQGVTARPTSTGFVAVDLGYEADPISFTPEVIKSEQARMGGADSWRWRKEYERDFYAQAGQPVFERPWINRQRSRAMEPLYRMDLDADGNLVKRERGRLAVYLPPDHPIEDLPERSLGADRCVALGIDVGEGIEGSDSTIIGMFSDRREQVCQFADNTIRPYRLGVFAAAVARYYNNALVLPVRKMHGITVIRALVDSGYTFIWRHKDPGKMIEIDSADLGWKRGESSDEVLFGKWVDAMETDDTILHGLETIDQHGQYIYDDLGRVCWQKLKNQPKEVRERHGDLVVACALAYRACLDMPAYRNLRKKQPPHNSYEARRRDFERRQQAQEAGQW